jgi:FG-GAP repeat protein
MKPGPAAPLAALVLWMIGSVALLKGATVGRADPPGFTLARTLANPAATAGDQFGQAVAFVGDNVLVGARWADMGGTDAGAAYLFDGKTGELLRTFQKPEPAAGDWFGTSVAAVGDNVLIGALGDDTGAHDAGAAYLFDGKTGDLLRVFQKPVVAEDDWFGAAVAGVGANVLVGAPLDDLSVHDGGAAYLFDGKTGALLRTFRNPAPAADDWFGSSLAAQGERVAIGAFLDDAGKRDAGSAYLFDAATGDLLRTLPNPIPAADDWFSVGLALTDRFLLAGAPLQDSGGKDVGAAYLYDLTAGLSPRSPRSPSSPLALHAPTPSAGEQFGNAVAVTGDLLLIGAPRAANGKAGAAYLLDATTGGLVQRIQGPAPADGDQLGFAVAASSGSLLVGAPGDPAGTSPGGAVLQFTR